jgi:hypothetical protein
MPGKIIVDSLGIGLAERTRLGRKPGHFVARRAGEAELAHEDIDGERFFVVSQAFAKPALPDDSHKQHLHESIVSVKEAEPALQFEQAVAPDLNDPARCSPRADFASGDFKRAGR